MESLTKETRFLYEGGLVVLETDGSGSQTARNVYGGSSVISRETAEGKAYYLYNGRGDVVQLTNASGSVTTAYEYDAFGNIKEANPNDTNPFRWCGEYFDAETKTVYLRARYYSPELGRFTQEDTYRGSISDPLSLNLYTYCNNNPVIYHDPTGHASVVVSGKTYDATIVDGKTYMADGSRVPNGAIVYADNGKTYQMRDGQGVEVTVVNVSTNTGTQIGAIGSDNRTIMSDGNRPSNEWTVHTNKGDYVMNSAKDEGTLTTGSGSTYVSLLTAKASNSIGSTAGNIAFDIKIEAKQGSGFYMTPQGGFTNSITIEGRTYVCVEDIVAAENYMTAEVDYHTGCLTVKFMGATLNFYGTGGQEWRDARYGISYITYSGRTYVDLEQFNKLLHSRLGSDFSSNQIKPVDINNADEYTQGRFIAYYLTNKLGFTKEISAALMSNMW